MSLKLSCFCMMRNEAPILNPFLDQLEEFFDQSVIIDHASTDRSKEICESRKIKNLEIFNLVSSGYPQSQVATYFTNKMFESGDSDYIFFLDCDEFLPFSNRNQLEAFLLQNKKYDIIELPWLNICPDDLGGGNIFTRPFFRRQSLSGYVKVIVSRRAFQPGAPLKILQGYHVAQAMGRTLSTTRAEAGYLLHIPIRSKVQIASKLVSGHNRLVSEKKLLRRGEGSHWKELANEFRFQTKPTQFLQNLALNYPDVVAEEYSTSKIDFNFPYVKSEHKEDQDHISKSIVGLLSEESQKKIEGNSLSIFAQDGSLVYSEKSTNTETNIVTEQVAELNQTSLDGRDAECFASLYEPLFNLPTKMPATAWSGHIPFLFVLFKLLKPRSYVELGVHNGASFIAACTAAKQYQLETQLFGVDCWEGDEHAGFYEGEGLYQDLLSYTQSNFKNTRLIRSYFSEARPSFMAGSIDLLHIDGLHTYEAVKEDFMTWVTAMSGSGVILFHDTNVHDRGFGVHRLWKELSEKYTTLEFFHSFGLGVLFLDDGDERIAHLVALARDPKRWRTYRDLVSLIAQGLPERMGWLENSQRVMHLENECGGLRAECGGLRAECGGLRAENDELRRQLRKSYRWRLKRLFSKRR